MSSEKTNIAVAFLTLLTCHKFAVTANKTANIWRTAGQLTGLIFNKCWQPNSDLPQEQFLLILQECLKRGSLHALDRSLESDVIKIANGIELVRYRHDNGLEDVRTLRFKTSEKAANWKQEVLEKVGQVFSTHVLKIRFNSRNSLDEGRGRRKQNMMVSLMMFGITAVGLIMVPMGFQFLAVLGGKALLLAKMALILTAIQGLKKIATSNVNYGLYSAPPDLHGRCKDEFCDITNLENNPFDDASFLVDVDLNQPYNYERQWPLESEHPAIAANPYKNYYPYQYQDSPSPDLLHPRISVYKDVL